MSKMQILPIQVNVTTIQEIIEYARKLAWQLSMTNEQIIEITGKLSKCSDFDTALDVLQVYFSNYLTIKRN